MLTVACKFHIGEHVSLLEVEFVIMMVVEQPVVTFLHGGNGT